MAVEGGTASRSARILEGLRASGVPLPSDEATAFAVDFALLLVSVSALSDTGLPKRHPAMLVVLGRRTVLVADAAVRLLAIVETPEFRGRVNDAELEAYRARFGDEAAAVLEDARPKFPEEPLFSYNLACYRAVVGNLTEAKRLLAEAFSMDASLRITALDDPDLVGVWDSFNDPTATSLEKQR